MKTTNLYLIIFYTYSLSAHNVNLISIKDLMQQRPNIEYIKCQDKQPFHYKPFSLSKFPELQPHKGLLAESFVVTIPGGRVCSWEGWIEVDGLIIQDFIINLGSLQSQIERIEKTKFENLKKISGRVAVITMVFDSCFFHWIYNVLGRLALKIGRAHV